MRSALRDRLGRPETYTVPGIAVVGLALWEWTVRALGIPEILVPAPSAVARSLWLQMQLDSFWIDAGWTVFETVAGFAIGATAAIVLGGVIAQFGLVEKAFYPYVVGLQTVPKIAIAPLLVIWLGFGISSKIVIAAIIAFFPILVNVIEGLKASRPQEIELLRSLCASRWQIFTAVKVPNAMPFLFAGLDIGIVFAVLGAIVGEFVGSQIGLGYRIQQLDFKLDIPGVFAVLFVLSILGVSLHLVVRAVQRRVVFWAHAEQVIGA